MIYLFAIGGTGAKIAHAYTMLCAAGITPKENISVEMSFLDPDRSNGNVGRANDTAFDYAKVRSAVSIIDFSPFLRQEIRPAEKTWGPLDGVRKTTLAELFAKSTLKEKHPSLASLMDVLYTKEEQDQDLHYGFRGHPSIGAAVLADRFDPAAEDSPIRNVLKAAEEAAGKHESISVILLGSIFGGTGAAGVPTLAKGLQSELKRLNLTNVSINSVLALPYFGFSFTEEQKNNIGLFADSASFLDNTRAALDYYYHTEVNDLFDSTYCIGLDHYARMPTAKEGGADQLNPACLVELLGATAIHDIASNEGKSNGLVMLSAYRGGQDIDAPDIPVLSQGDNNLKMTRFTALSLALKAIVFPIIDADNEQSAQYPWVRDLLPSKEDSWSSIVGDTLPLKNLANSYLRWFSEISRTTPNLKNVLGGLFRDDSITDMRRLIELLRSYEKGDDNKALYHLIEEYSAASMHPTNRGKGVAGIMHAMTSAIEKVTSSGTSR